MTAIGLAATTRTPPAALDPALPELAEALDTMAVAARFEHRWPVPGPPPSLRACSLQHARWHPGVGCVATYELDISTAVGEPATTIGAVIVDATGVRHRLFTQDEDLPGLKVATDAVSMAGWFSARLHRQVDTCKVTPVRYRSGTRCVIRYDAGGRDNIFYGKVVAPQRFPALSTALSELAEGLVPAIVGFAAEAHLVVQADAGQPSLAGRSLEPGAAGLLDDLRACGELLHRLHSSAGPGGSVRSMAGDADALDGYLGAAAAVAPSSAAAIEQGIDQLRTYAQQTRPTVPSHGAFRLDQVHVAPDPVLIDLDSYCWAEPERDIGNLFAYLRWRVIRGAASSRSVAEARRAFLSGYASPTRTPLDPDRLRAFEAASLLKIAGRRYRSLAVDEWPRVPTLIEAAREQLRAGAGRR